MKHFLSIAGFVFLIGCGSKGGADKIVSDYEGFKDRMCKCADKACADQVNKDTEAWMMKMAETMKDTKPTKEQDAKFDAIQNELEACEKKFAEPEPPPPADPVPADPAAGSADPAAGSAAPADPAAPATP